MRLIFLPKHQKLVNQCYPPGRTPDKKPKSSETSYLLYYVNSRRSKLEKVSAYLAKKSKGDLYHRRLGNIAVTLDLLNQIIIHCKENLNVFVRNFLNIMQSVVSNNGTNNDISLIELVEIAYQSICKNAETSLFSGDPEFVGAFQTFTDSLLKIVAERVHNDDLLMRVCIDISFIANLASNTQLNYLIVNSVTHTVNKFQEANPHFKERILEPLRDLQNTRTLSRTQSRILAPENYDGIPVPPVEDLSVQSLNCYFNTTATDKLNLSLITLFGCLQINSNRYMLEYVSNMVPVQLRYIIIIMLTRQLNPMGKQLLEPLICLKFISALLVSNVSIIGLSVLDIMRKILTFQLKNLSKSEIVEQCTLTITDLNTKRYYLEQTSDIVNDLLIRIKSVANEYERNAVLNNIKSVLSCLDEPSINLTLFNELALQLKSNYIEMFDLVENRAPPSFVFSGFFRLLRSIDSRPVKRKLMHLSFVKFNKILLISGLNFFLNETTEPDYAYYLYHLEAAKMLNDSTYIELATTHMDNNTLFTKESLLEIYNSAKISNCSKAATQILSSDSRNVSTTDLLSDTGRFKSQNVANNPMPDYMFANSLNARKKDENEGMFMTTDTGNLTALHDDQRYWKSIKPTAPKVTELKRMIHDLDGKSVSEIKRDLAHRGTQSVKSKVTNITFLLSELKTNNASHEYHRIQDPDEEKIIGMDTIDRARSVSVRLNPDSGLRGAKVPSTLRHASTMKRQKNNDDDEYEDAQEQFIDPGTRGKLFSN